MITTDQLLGLEINEYARELAQVVIWIGYLQWMIRNGFGFPEPVLDPLETIRLQDALLDRTDPEHPKEAEWPEADYIIGNPPFLGGKRMRTELGDEYVDDLFCVFDGRLRARPTSAATSSRRRESKSQSDEAKRAGLLATNSIRGGANRESLIGSRKPATSSWHGPTNLGSSTVLRFAFRSLALMMALKRERCSTGSRFRHDQSADLTSAVDITRLPSAS